MKRKELHNLIKKTLKEIDLRENIIGYVDGDINQPICGCNGVNWINCGGGCACCGMVNPAESGAILMGVADAETVDKSDGTDLSTVGAITVNSPDASKALKQNKNNKKTQMAKQNLKERFSQLAGIKPLYEIDDKEMESSKEYTKEELMNEGPELWPILGSLLGIIGAAGITGQLQAMAEDPAIAEKYPKLEKVFSMLAKVGGSLGSGIKETEMPNNAMQNSVEKNKNFLRRK